MWITSKQGQIKASSNTLAKWLGHVSNQRKRRYFISKKRNH